MKNYFVSYVLSYPKNDIHFTENKDHDFGMINFETNLPISVHILLEWKESIRKKFSFKSSSPFVSIISFQEIAKTESLS